ncbi:helix-turn-helix domain-containing protein [Peribacillus loiseleuriae]|uniref:helix-turn-helix domain-containing protein n=1 Tax=Peribacillus loiseleuriae TaxID=1679170 RepID=UPI00380F9E4D
MIGENIVKIRKRRGYSLSKLAELTNISKSYLSNIERNLNKNPSLQIMLKIAAVLNVDLETLLKTDKDEDTYIEKEWVDFVNELKELGVEKNEIHQYKTLIEYIKWQNQHSNTK